MTPQEAAMILKAYWPLWLPLVVVFVWWVVKSGVGPEPDDYRPLGPVTLPDCEEE